MSEQIPLTEEARADAHLLEQPYLDGRSAYPHPIRVSAAD